MNQMNNHVCGHWPHSLAFSRELHTEGLLVRRTFSFQLSEEHLNKGQTQGFSFYFCFLVCLYFAALYFLLSLLEQSSFFFRAYEAVPMFSVSQEQGETESPPGHLESASHPQNGISGVKSTPFALLQDSLQFGADTAIMAYDIKATFLWV